MYVLIESNTAAREAMADAIRLDNPQISRRVGLMRQISGAKVGASGRKPSPLANTNRESRPGRLDGQERLALACMEVLVQQLTALDDVLP